MIELYFPYGMAIALEPGIVAEVPAQFVLVLEGRAKQLAPMLLKHDGVVVADPKDHKNNQRIKIDDAIDRLPKEVAARLAPAHSQRHIENALVQRARILKLQREIAELEAGAKEPAKSS